MSHYSILFSHVLLQIPRHDFESLVKQHGAGRYTKKLSTWNQFTALLYAHGCDAGAGRAQGGRLVVLHTAEAGEAGAMHALLAAGTLPDLRRPSADSYYRIESFPVLGTCKLDLKARSRKRWRCPEREARRDRLNGKKGYICEAFGFL